MFKLWYTCKVKYMKFDDNGNESTVTESYLVDAMSYNEAETRIYEEMEQRVRGEFRVMNISKANYADVISDEELVDWYKVKVTGVEYDEESDKEKKYNNYYLVGADSCKQAIERTEESLKDMTMDFIIPAVNFVQLVDVFPYGEGQDSALAEEEIIDANFDPETGEIIE